MDAIVRRDTCSQKEHVMAIRPEVIEDASGGPLDPIAVTFKVGSRITGLGNTTLWKYGKEGRIELIRPPGTRRTLISYSSLKTLFSPKPTDTRRPRPRSRPRKVVRP
jgi:hypothetical protein